MPKEIDIRKRPVGVMQLSDRRLDDLCEETQSLLFSGTDQLSSVSAVDGRLRRIIFFFANTGNSADRKFFGSHLWNSKGSTYFHQVHFLH